MRAWRNLDRFPARDATKWKKGICRWNISVSYRENPVACRRPHEIQSSVKIRESNPKGQGFKIRGPKAKWLQGSDRRHGCFPSTAQRLLGKMERYTLTSDEEPLLETTPETMEGRWQDLLVIKRGENVRTGASTEGTVLPALGVTASGTPCPRKPCASFDLSPTTAQDRPWHKPVTDHWQLRQSLGSKRHLSDSPVSLPSPHLGLCSNVTLTNRNSLTTSAKKNSPLTPSLLPGPYFSWFFYHCLTSPYIFMICLPH